MAKTAKKKLHLHEKRGLSFAELGALMGVREMLANGVLKYKQRVHFYEGSDHVFNMNKWYEPNDNCGSVQCIGGAMAQILGRPSIITEPDDELEGNAELHDLFYPPPDYDYSLVEPAQAVKAIDNFLTKGKAMWDKILRKNQLQA